MSWSIFVNEDLLLCIKKGAIIIRSSCLTFEYKKWPGIYIYTKGCTYNNLTWYFQYFISLRCSLMSMNMNIHMFSCVLCFFYSFDYTMISGQVRWDDIELINNSSLSLSFFLFYIVRLDTTSKSLIISIIRTACVDLILTPTVHIYIDIRWMKWTNNNNHDVVFFSDVHTHTHTCTIYD